VPCTTQGPCSRSASGPRRNALWLVAHIRTKTLNDGSRAYLVRYRAPNGKERSQQFRRKRDAAVFAATTETATRARSTWRSRTTFPSPSTVSPQPHANSSRNGLHELPQTCRLRYAQPAELQAPCRERALARAIPSCRETEGVAVWNIGNAKSGSNRELRRGSRDLGRGLLRRPRGTSGTLGTIPRGRARIVRAGRSGAFRRVLRGQHPSWPSAWEWA